MRRLPAEVRARQLGATAETIVDLADDVDPERDHIRGAPRRARSRCSSTATSSARTAGTPRRSSSKLLERLGDELRYVFRHLPLTDVHPNAQIAAEAAEAAGAQGASGRCTTACSPTRTRSRPRDLYRHAADLGLDLERFAEDLRRRRHAPRVAEDVRSADASGVSGTPTFFINGRRHHGVYDEETLARAVKAAARAPVRA